MAIAPRAPVRPLMLMVPLLGRQVAGGQRLTGVAMMPKAPIRPLIMVVPHGTTTAINGIGRKISGSSRTSSNGLATIPGLMTLATTLGLMTLATTLGLMTLATLLGLMTAGEHTTGLIWIVPGYIGWRDA